MIGSFGVASGSVIKPPERARLVRHTGLHLPAMWADIDRNAHGHHSTEDSMLMIGLRGGFAMGTRRLSALLVTVLCAGLLGILAPIAQASTGTIKGKLTNEDGEPVVGASVLVVGTTRGAVTDLDGNYTIRNLEPGRVTLRITSLEYATVEITDVLVRLDITTEQNQVLERTALETGEVITVEGTQEIIDKFNVANQVSIGAEEIQHRPVQTVDNILQSVAGVQTTNTGEIFIRGGRAGEVAFIVDGVPISDPLGGLGSAGASLNLTAGSIQEIQVIKGGFDPEFGNALSGIVNIRSNFGNKDNTQLSIQYITDDLGNTDLNKYSRNQDFLTLTLSGPDPILSSRILPALGLKFLEGREFTYYLYAEVDKNDGIYQYNDFTSPTTRFERRDFSLFGVGVPERLFNRYNIQTNFRFRPRQNLQFRLSYKLWDTRNTAFGRFDWEYRYTPNTAQVQERVQQSLSFEVVHAVDKNTTYEVLLSYLQTDITQKPGDPNNPGRGLDPDQIPSQGEWERFNDVNGNGIYDPPEPIINLFPDTALYGTDYSGPGYTFGENLFLDNVQGGGGGSFANFRFNNNGVVDSLEGEAFVDLNGNGVWDAGDFLVDKNGNGLYDLDLRERVFTPRAEPFIDGDSIIGEPFTDLNGNGVYDEGIDGFVISFGADNQDLNRDGIYNGPNQIWSPGVPFFDRNGNGLYDPPNFTYDPGEQFTDVNGNGVYDRGGSSDFLLPNTYADDIIWLDQQVRTLRAEFKATRLAGNHELKVGGFIQRDDFSFGLIDRPYINYSGRPDGGAFPDRGAFRDFYSYDPWQGALYFRDKLEYGSMIASLGIRWDFFLQDVNDLASTFRDDDQGGLLLGDRQKVSPRIGFSYPISDKAKVYFNYGHFYQLPTFGRFYARNTSSANQNDVLGNPNLDYQKTIQYAFGVRYAVTENYALDIQGYFKDEFDKINQTSELRGSIRRNVYTNSDYGRSRGIELTLERRGSGYVNGEISYTYQFAFGKASEAAEAFLDQGELDRQPLDEAPLDNDVRHSLKSSIIFFIPSTVKPRLFGIPIPNGWTLNITSILESGAPFTPATNFPNLSQSGVTDPQRNSLRYPSTAFFDVRFAKEFEIEGLDFEAILWVENIFDNRNVEFVYSATGRPDTRQNRNGVVLEGTPFDVNPYNYDEGRQVRLGLQLNL